MGSHGQGGPGPWPGLEDSLAGTGQGAHRALLVWGQGAFAGWCQAVPGVVETLKDTFGGWEAWTARLGQSHKETEN